MQHLVLGHLLGAERSHDHVAGTSAVIPWPQPASKRRMGWAGRLGELLGRRAHWPVRGVGRRRLVTRRVNNERLRPRERSHTPAFGKCLAGEKYAGLFSLPFRDWCPLRVYSLFPSTIGARCGYILSPLSREEEEKP
eukprot:1175467-Prorocentrum_minimum.AAC.2